MRVISRRTLKEFWEEHPDAEAALSAWYHDVTKAKWASCVDIISEIPYADCLRDNRVCFNIRGNNYRLIVKIHYNTGIVYIRFVGTHAEYDRINALAV